MFMRLGEATQTHHDLERDDFGWSQNHHALTFVLPIMFMRLGEATQTHHDLEQRVNQASPHAFASGAA
jgi:hypothetical protein